MKMINESSDVGSRLALIQQLIPIGLMAVEEALQVEVCELAGVRYHRDENPNKRWGSNIGSAYLGDQKHNIRVPRVRNAESKEKVRLSRYQALQLINESAVVSLDEGLEDTLTLHRLGLFEQLGLSLKTTNCIESLNSQLEQYTRRVSYWKNSNKNKAFRP